MIILIKPNQNRREAIQAIERRNPADGESAGLQGSAITSIICPKYHNLQAQINKNDSALAGGSI